MQLGSPKPCLLRDLEDFLHPVFGKNPEDRNTRAGPDELRNEAGGNRPGSFSKNNAQIGRTHLDRAIHVAGPHQPTEFDLNGHGEAPRKARA
jgi:hypothetical protein